MTIQISKSYEIFYMYKTKNYSNIICISKYPNSQSWPRVDSFTTMTKLSEIKSSDLINHIILKGSMTYISIEEFEK